MYASISRREFLKLGALAATTLAARPLRSLVGQQSTQLGRVTYDSVSVFDAPRLNANTVGYQFRDTLLDIEYSLNPLTGPPYNSLWHRIADGYVHSAWIQPVKNEPNTPMTSIPEAGQLFRVTVPFTQPYRYSTRAGWQVVNQFRLYYQSNHRVTGIRQGPDGESWYLITEPWEGTQYYAAAVDLQPIAASELAPISPDVPSGEKHIEISLVTQQLAAYETDQLVLRIPISSGVQNSSGNGLPSQTPTGTFNIYSKLPTKYMGDNRLANNLGDHYLVGVPWTMFFIEGGYAIHGAYWHNNFGAPMSRGCINVRPDHAQWLYRWTTPAAGPNDWETPGYGTRVVVS
jgi:lipoprotein-anchoring transpeptidase ErfK/SrfK